MDYISHLTRGRIEGGNKENSLVLFLIMVTRSLLDEGHSILSASLYKGFTEDIRRVSPSEEMHENV